MRTVHQNSLFRGRHALLRRIIDQFEVLFVDRLSHNMIVRVYML